MAPHPGTPTLDRRWEDFPVLQRSGPGAGGWDDAGFAEIQAITLGAAPSESTFRYLKLAS